MEEEIEADGAEEEEVGEDSPNLPLMAHEWWGCCTRAPKEGWGVPGARRSAERRLCGWAVAPGPHGEALSGGDERCLELRSNVSFAPGI